MEHEQEGSYTRETYNWPINDEQEIGNPMSELAHEIYIPTDYQFKHGGDE